MKSLKLLAVALFAALFVTPCHAEESILTNSNGLAAGKALLSLYSQYKTDGKLDLSNSTNVTNLISLATNVKGLSEKIDTKNFLSGLISGSKQLVNNTNSTSVLSTLSQIAGLDLSSLGSTVAKSAAKSAAKKAAGSLLSKVGLGSSNSTSTSSDSSDLAASILTGLFSTIKQ